MRAAGVLGAVSHDLASRSLLPRLRVGPDLDGHSRPLSQHAYKSLAAALAFQTEVLEWPTIVRADVVLLVRSLRKPEGPELFVPVEVM